MKFNKLPEIGSYVELFAPFDQTWFLSKHPVTSHGFSSESHTPYFILGQCVKWPYPITDEDTWWRIPSTSSNALQKVLDRLLPNPPEALVDALKALPDSLLKAFLSHMHAPGCDEHCTGCSCPKGNQDPSNVCQHCFYTNENRKTGKLPEIGSQVELWSTFSHKWKLSHSEVISHGQDDRTGHPYFVLDKYPKAQYPLRSEGKWWRHYSS